MSTPLRETLNLLTKRTEKKFDMRVRRIKKQTQLILKQAIALTFIARVKAKQNQLYQNKLIAME